MKKETKNLKQIKLSCNVVTDFDMRYDMISCEIGTDVLSCQLKDNAINYIVGSYSSKISAYIPPQTEGCRDFVIFANSIDSGLEIVLGEIEMYYDEDFDFNDFAYTGNDAIYSFTEVTSGKFLVSKKNVIKTSDTNTL